MIQTNVCTVNLAKQSRIDLLSSQLDQVNNRQRMMPLVPLLAIRAFISRGPRAAPLTQLPWTHNLAIFSQSKRQEELEFYLRMAIQEQWSRREFERQFRAVLLERSVTQPEKGLAVLTQTHPAENSGCRKEPSVSR